MSSSEKRPVTVMERLSTLIALGEGILPRIYYMKNKISKKRDIYLGGDRLLKVRKVLAIKFPKIPNDEKMAAIPNSDAFFSDIAGICRRLKGFSELTYTIMEFAASSSNLLLSIPKISMVTFSYEQHTEIVSAYLKLLKLYVRIFIFFSSIKEVKTVYAMYHAAVLFLNKQGKNKLQSHEVDQKYLSKLHIHVALLLTSSVAILLSLLPLFPLFSFLACVLSVALPTRGQSPQSHSSQMSPSHI